MLTADEISKLPTNPDKSSAEAGKDTMLYVDDGAGTSTPNWVIVGGQRNSPVDRSADEIDASDKTTEGWKKTVPGLKSWSVSYSGLIIRSDKGLNVLRACFDNDKEAHVKTAYPDGSYDSGWCYVTSFSTDYAHDGLATLTATLSGVGKLTSTAAST